MHIVNRKSNEQKKSVNSTINIVSSISILVSVTILTLIFFSKSDLSEKQRSVIRGRYEGCVNCHNQMIGFVSAHKTAQIGCAVCHRGNVTTIEKEIAHEGMILSPGNSEKLQKHKAVKYTWYKIFI